MKENKAQVISGIGEKCNGGTQYHQQNRIYNDSIAIAVTTSFNPYYLEKTSGGGKNIMNQQETENELLKRINNGEKLDLQITDIEYIPTEEAQLRIRKLTPRECFRLMGLKDEDIDLIMENQTQSSAYHLAGDSIVTTCLMAIFGELLNIDWKEHFRKEEWWHNEQK